MHYFISHHQRLDYALVVEDVVEREGAGGAVFEPLLGGLVAADVEVPGGGGNAVEVLVGVNPDAADCAVEV